jgi:hypothetical protein
LGHRAIPRATSHERVEPIASGGSPAACRIAELLDHCPSAREALDCSRRVPPGRKQSLPTCQRFRRTIPADGALGLMAMTSWSVLRSYGQFLDFNSWPLNSAVHDEPHLRPAKERHSLGASSPPDIFILPKAIRHRGHRVCTDPTGTATCVESGMHRTGGILQARFAVAAATGSPTCRPSALRT